MMQNRTVSVAAVLAALVGAPAWAQEAELEPFALGFAIDSMVQQIPYHVAREFGYFAEEGLDVEFQ